MTENKIRIGVLSDTHGRLDVSVLEKFVGVYRIIHAGDVGMRRYCGTWKL